MLEFTEIPKVPTRIPGLDMISEGGLPIGRTTLVSGSAGSGKTILAAQFLAHGCEDGESAVFVTFEETPADLRRNLQSFGWDIQAWEDQGLWAFVDASADIDSPPTFSGDYDLGALFARIESAVRTVGASRVALDSIGAILNQIPDGRLIRAELFRLTALLKRIGVTALLTSERSTEHGDIGKFGIEEFVTDNVIVLRNLLEQERRHRTIEILKFRGTHHLKGETPFSVVPRRGIVVIPLSGYDLSQVSSNLRISSGNSELDDMCHGGFFRDMVALVSGATGAGKTLMVTEYVRAVQDSPDEKALVFAYEESRDQLTRNAAGWGVDYEQMERDGKLRIVASYPESLGYEDHLIKMKAEIDDFQPTRIAIDSMSALERAGSQRSFREFVIAITSTVKAKEISALLTSTTPTLMGGSSVTESHISSITDGIILLRYVEGFGDIRRGITVLKLRGSQHDNEIREFDIGENGMRIGKTFRKVTGILTGVPVHFESEIESIEQLFPDPEGKA